MIKVKINSAKLNSAYNPEDSLEDLWDFIQEQEFDSAETSQSIIAATFKNVNFPAGSLVVDYGGGRYDHAIEYLKKQDVICAVYDPFNRSQEYNKQTMAVVKEHGGADFVTCNNVLNVIKEDEVRLSVLKNINRIIKPGGTIYFLIHEGTKKDREIGSRMTKQKTVTKDGKEVVSQSWQNFQKAEWYMEAIQSVWPQAVRKGKMIIVENA